MNILKVSIASVTTAILFQGLPATAQQAITPDDMPRVIDSLCMNKGVSTSAEAICEDTVVEPTSSRLDHKKVILDKVNLKYQK
jgi:hypothetical protein